MKEGENNIRPLKELIDNCENIVYWELDADFTIVASNPLFCQTVGLSSAEVQGINLSKVMSASDFNDFIASLESGITSNLQHQLVSTNGVQHHFVTCVQLQETTLKRNHYSCVSIIESTKVITQKVIKRLQALNKTILNSLTDAIIFIDLTNKIHTISSGFYSIWGFAEGEIHIMNLQDVQFRMESLLHNQSPCSDLSFMQNSAQNPSVTTKNIVKLKNEKVFEIKATPHVYDSELIGMCLSFKDITKQTVLVEKLGKLAFRDSLTRLYNRRWCERKLKQLLKTSSINNLAFLYLDLDHFKVINDSCGHIHGDEVLEEISSILLKTTDQNSFLARLGGDEFGFILIDKSKKEVIKVISMIQKVIQKYTFHWKKKIFKLGISIGVVFVSDEDDFRSIFIHADEACYLSKETGRNKYTIYNANDHNFQKTKTQLKWYNSIQKALIKSDFELWIQPIISENHEMLQHYEILLRMRDKQDKLISPSEFMEAADRFGLIYSIDKTVISKFCAFYSAHRQQLKNCIFSINVSGHSLSRNGFLPFVKKCLGDAQVDFTRICFEITENEVIQDLDKALHFIKDIKRMGCMISLDDFGKGLTSFSYLKDIPYDYIKIDGQFVKEIFNDPINEAVIKSIVYIAEVMHKKTIAEHVESEALLQKLSELGVNYFQGNYFSKPKSLIKLLE